MKRTLTNKKNLHVKPGNVLEKLKFTGSDSNPSYWDETEHLIKYYNFGDDTEPFYKTTVIIIQKFILI